MAPTYLGYLWRRRKSLFFLACLFIGGAFLPAVIHFEITPFYDWKMYAWPVQPAGRYDAYVLRYNGKTYNKPHTWQDYSRMMIMYTLPHYALMRRTGDTLPFYTKTSYAALAAFKWNRQDNTLHMSSAELAAYPAWLRRYTGQQTGEAIGSLSVQRVSLRYTAQNRVVPVAAETIIAE